MTKNHFQSHFSPFQINTQLLFFDFFFKMAAGRHFGSPFWAILDDRKLLSIAFLTISDQYATFLFEFFFKMAAILEVRFARGHFVFPIDEKNHRILVICDLNGYGEYEFDRCICDSYGLYKLWRAVAETAEAETAAAAQPKP